MEFFFRILQFNRRMYLQKEKYVTLLHSVKQAQFQKEVLKREITILTDELKHEKLTNLQLSSKFTEMRQYVYELQKRLGPQNVGNHVDYKCQKNRLFYDQTHLKEPQGVSTGFDYQKGKPNNFESGPLNHPTVFKPIGNIIGNTQNQVQNRFLQEAKIWQNQKPYGTPGRVQWSGQGRQFPNQGQFPGEGENMWQYGQNPYLNQGRGHSGDMWQYQGKNPYYNQGNGQNQNGNYQQCQNPKWNKVHGHNNKKQDSIDPNQDQSSSEDQNQDTQIQTQAYNPQVAKVPGQINTQVQGQTGVQTLGQPTVQVPGQLGAQVPGQPIVQGQDKLQNGVQGFSQVQTQLQTILQQIQKIKPKKKKKKKNTQPKP